MPTVPRDGAYRTNASAIAFALLPGRKRLALQEAALKDAHLLEEMYRELEASQQEIDSLYERWMELEEKTR